jgi:hypothetical protein
MNRASGARSRQRLQLISLLILLTASALEIWAVGGGLDTLRDSLLVTIALTMIVAAARG